MVGYRHLSPFILNCLPLLFSEGLVMIDLVRLITRGNCVFAFDSTMCVDPYPVPFKLLRPPDSIPELHLLD